MIRCCKDLWIAIVLLALLTPTRVRAADAPTARRTPAGDTVRLVFVHVNDVHGRLEPRMDKGHSIGGYARLSTFVQHVRQTANADRVFLIHAGDEFSRGDDLTTRTQGAANIQIMNALGFDVWTPGNGDIYNGLGNLESRIREAHCQTLAANLTLADTHQPIAHPYVIERVGDVRIAFFGLCFIHKEHPSSWAMDWTDPIQTAKALVPQLRAQADLVVAVDHIGWTEDRKLASQVPGIDLIIGGHSHTVLPHGVQVRDPEGHMTLVCQAGDLLRFAGQANITLQRSSDPTHPWQVTQLTDKLTPLDEKVKIDPAITALIARLSAAAATRPTASAPATR